MPNSVFFMKFHDFDWIKKSVRRGIRHRRTGTVLLEDPKCD